MAFVVDTHEIPKKRLMKIVKRLNEKQVDLLLLGGDFCYLNDVPEGSISILSKIKTTDGIYGVEGNHDNYVSLFTAMEKYSITPLSDEGRYIKRGFYLAGTKDYWNRNPDISQITEVTSGDDFVLLVTHNPDTLISIMMEYCAANKEDFNKYMKDYIYLYGRSYRNTSLEDGVKQ